MRSKGQYPIFKARLFRVPAPSFKPPARSQEWLRVEARDRKIRVWFPAPEVISDLVVVCHSPKPGPWGTGLKIPEVHCVFAHPTCSLKIPLCLFAKSSRFGHGYRARLEYYGFCCILERITLSALKDKTTLLLSTDYWTPGASPCLKSGSKTGRVLPALPVNATTIGVWPFGSASD